MRWAIVQHRPLYKHDTEASSTWHEVQIDKISVQTALSVQTNLQTNKRLYYGLRHVWMQDDIKYVDM